MQEFRPVLYNSYYMAFSVETMFKEDGPAVTRTGFLTYLRAMVMSDPDEAFKDFGIFSQAMKLGPRLERSQFPREADPEVKKIAEYLKSYTTKVLLSIGMKVYDGPFCDVCYNSMGDSWYHNCQECDGNYASCQECLVLALKKHTPGHTFVPDGNRSTQASQGTVHEDITCDICFGPVVGVRHHCENCSDYDLCQSCIGLAQKKHYPGHRFKAMESSTSHQAQLNQLEDVMTRMAIANSAAHSEQMNRIGIDDCYDCGYKRCRC
ncbi:hypothetical protein BGZ99_010318 [Dissophora globulifera]|uniref:ZZ-type domain-containing protein n=1 Tax=Dissophora globulifera TaxID=979702 RepID=A0A9P6R285_9FUNG|nr:hypothetical protein BGZ99_010318 [Dissophora globulifera]